MGTPWATIALGITTLVINAFLLLWVSGPRRKRLVDEVVIRDGLAPSATRDQLTELIERAATKYVKRRRRGPWDFYGRYVTLMLLIAAAGLALLVSGSAKAAGLTLLTSTIGIQGTLVLWQAVFMLYRAAAEKRASNRQTSEDKTRPGQ